MMVMGEGRGWSRGVQVTTSLIVGSFGQVIWLFRWWGSLGA